MPRLLLLVDASISSKKNGLLDAIASRITLADPEYLRDLDHMFSEAQVLVYPPWNPEPETLTILPRPSRLPSIAGQLRRLKGRPWSPLGEAILNTLENIAGEGDVVFVVSDGEWNTIGDDRDKLDNIINGIIETLKNKDIKLIIEICGKPSLPTHQLINRLLSQASEETTIYMDTMCTKIIENLVYTL